MENLDFEDRRIFFRFPASLPLRYINLNLKTKGQAQTCNISANGIGLVTDEQLLPHTPLDIRLDIPDNGHPLHTKGEVVWAKKIESNKYIIGISLQKVELMGISRVLVTNRALKDAGTEKSQRIKRFFLWKWFNILKIVKLKR